MTFDFVKGSPCLEVSAQHACNDWKQCELYCFPYQPHCRNGHCICGAVNKYQAATETSVGRKSLQH